MVTLQSVHQSENAWQFSMKTISTKRIASPTFSAPGVHTPHPAHPNIDVHADLASVLIVAVAGGGDDGGPYRLYFRVLQLPNNKMGSISLKDFSKEISPANEQAALNALLQVSVRRRIGWQTAHPSTAG